jgi:hypothetical protein
VASHLPERAERRGSPFGKGHGTSPSRRRSCPGRSCCSPRPSRSRSSPQCPTVRRCISPGDGPATGDEGGRPGADRG